MCEHVRSCPNCLHDEKDTTEIPCDDCGSELPDNRCEWVCDYSNFECAICKKEKATRQSDLIKGKK